MLSMALQLQKTWVCITGPPCCEATGLVASQHRGPVMLKLSSREFPLMRPSMENSWSRSNPEPTSWDQHTRGMSFMGTRPDHEWCSPGRWISVWREHEWRKPSGATRGTIGELTLGGMGILLLNKLVPDHPLPMKFNDNFTSWWEYSLNFTRETIWPWCQLLQKLLGGQHPIMWPMGEEFANKNFFSFLFIHHFLFIYFF